MILFTPVVSVEKLHPNFQAIMHPGFLGERDVISGWSQGFNDRDGKFVKEFQTTFNSSYWELYLHAVFKEIGLLIDWSHQSPDFNLSHSTCRFTVEATTANSAQKKPKEWERDFSRKGIENLKFDIPEINREATIRLSNAIVAKHRKYKENYSRLSHVRGKPFVIAVGPFEQPYFFLQHDRPIKSLLYDYYVDEEAFKKDPDKFPNGPPSVSLGTIEKDNGSEIDLGFFNSDVVEEISAVIFSATATMGKVDALATTGNKETLFNYMRHGNDGIPRIHTGISRKDYDETLLDGLQVYHNPHAKYPLDLGVFRQNRIIQCYFDHESREWCEEGVPGSLAWRQSFGIISDGDYEPDGYTTRD